MDLNTVLEDLREVLEKEDLQSAIKLIEDLLPRDLADLVSELETPDQIAVITELEPTDSAELMEVMDDALAVTVAEKIPPQQLAQILDEMEKDEAADVLIDLPPEQVEKTIRKMEEPDEIVNLMSYDRDTAGGLMTIAEVVLNAHWTVDKTLNELLKARLKSDSSNYLYVTDEDGVLVGFVGLRNLVSEDRSTKIAFIMETRLLTVLHSTHQEECANLLAKHNYMSLPVVDEHLKFLGIITADDLIAVSQEEATEDMFKMVGISGEERISGPARESIGKRLPWLAINMLTLFMAILVIDLFESVIAGLVVVAVFLPLVSGEGGNAGSQTATILVRGLAVGEIDISDMSRMLKKELAITLVNGFIIGLGTGIVAYWWKGEFIIGIAIFIAMICNFIMAALMGVIVPLGLKKINVDPALASAAFVTAFTDTFGFLFFLGFVYILS